MTLDNRLSSHDLLGENYLNTGAMNFQEGQSIGFRRFGKHTLFSSIQLGADKDDSGLGPGLSLT